MGKRSIWLIFSMVVIGFILVGCASEPDESGAEGNGDGQAQQEGGDLVIATVSDAVALDPAGVNDVPSFDVQYNIFEKLVKHDSDMNLQPSLAKSWETVDDNTWQFELQEGVTFHDGEPFNAEAVKANIERMLDPEVAAPHSYLLDGVEEVVAVDEYTVQFKTEYPISGLPSNLTHPVGSMISPKLIEEDYAAMENGENPGSVINENPIGTGYFKFDEWNTGQYLRLVKNEDYWDGTANIDTVTFKVVSEDLTRIAELQTGDSHISNPLSASDVEQLEQSEEMFVNQQGSVSLDYLGFNMEQEPFDDKLVRQAISMAINKDEIIDGIANGYAKKAIGPLAPGVADYDEDLTGLEYDVEQAKELLAEAGYPDGFSATIWTNETRERLDIATNVQAQLKAIGISIDIEVFEWAAYLEEIGKGNHDMFILGWSNSTAEANNGIAPLFHSDNIGPSGNRTFMQNDELDQLLDEGLTEIDEEERFNKYQRAQEILVEEAPVVYLMHKDYLMGVHESVNNLEMLPTKMLLLKDVTIEQ
ncbi:glutathione ABC transporter substrate-binding protein [Oceanobacillus kimchii]|uniref:Glutathione ABC transporter substrate-binding protein n=1 Tax=Oceanobacillus kimchii TaxID=746691 RepID=A0ABQ5TFP9_9BACI|nr:glutathione ABC transporter substrate-binding protein [Oceanobacillus kimchii]GLO64800.1 glutathione ABC transporter substrate-binding protein [Oceanobacillus kimchii]